MPKQLIKQTKNGVSKPKVITLTKSAIPEFTIPTKSAISEKAIKRNENVFETKNLKKMADSLIKTNKGWEETIADCMSAILILKKENAIAIG